jgi:nitrogen fixation-related uncharacterized protein
MTQETILLVGWVAMTVVGLAALTWVLVWAIRSGQFGQQDRARRLPMEGPPLEDRHDGDADKTLPAALPALAIGDFSYTPLQNQWLIIAAVGGVVVLVGMVLVYLAIWRRREGPLVDDAAEPAQAQRQPFWGWFKSFMPWALVLTYVGTFLWALAYLVMVALREPNW